MTFPECRTNKPHGRRIQHCNGSMFTVAGWERPAAYSVFLEKGVTFRAEVQFFRSWATGYLHRHQAFSSSGGRQRVFILTDHKPLTYAFNAATHEYSSRETWNSSGGFYIRFHDRHSACKKAHQQRTRGPPHLFLPLSFPLASSPWQRWKCRLWDVNRRPPSYCPFGIPPTNFWCAPQLVTSRYSSPTRIQNGSRSRPRWDAEVLHRSGAKMALR